MLVSRVLPLIGLPLIILLPSILFASTERLAAQPDPVSARLTADLLAGATEGLFDDVTGDPILPGPANSGLLPASGSPRGHHVLGFPCPTPEDCETTRPAWVGNSLFDGADHDTADREPWASESLILGATATSPFGGSGLAILTSILVVLGLAMLRWRTEP